MVDMYKKLLLKYISHFTGKVPFIHVGNQVVSELGPIVQFVKAKVITHSLHLLLGCIPVFLSTAVELLCSSGTLLFETVQQSRAGSKERYSEVRALRWKCFTLALPQIQEANPMQDTCIPLPISAAGFLHLCLRILKPRNYWCKF